jgi:hypothetical protein
MQTRDIALRLLPTFCDNVLANCQRTYGVYARALGSRSSHICLTNRWSGRVKDEVPSPHTGVRAAQLNR